MSSEWLDVVRATAGELKLLSADGKLIDLDSISIVDLSVALEEKLDLEIPSKEFRPKTFSSLDSIAELIGRLKQA